MAARAKQTGTTLPGSEDDYVPSFEKDSGNTGSEAVAATEQPPAELAITAQPSTEPAANLVTPASNTPADNTNSGRPAPNTIHEEIISR